jgi:hypothetical protein
LSLFGRHGKPRLVHLKSRGQAGAVILTWDVRGGPALRWRVLRSTRGFADGPFDDTLAGGQTLVSDKPAPGARDDTPEREGACFYAVFAESERGEWQREATVKLSADDPDLRRRAEGDFETGKTPSLDFREVRGLQGVDFRIETLKSRAQREHPSVKTDDVD